MHMKFSTRVLGVSLALSCSVSAVALADGMPFKESKPPLPILTLLDKGSSANTKEQPTNIVPAPPPAEPPTAAKAEVPPVPETRVVEVQPNASFFGLSVGMYDPFTHNEKASSLDLHWQPGVKIAGVLQPIFGAIATTNGASYGSGGIGMQPLSNWYYWRLFIP